MVKSDRYSKGGGGGTPLYKQYKIHVCAAPKGVVFVMFRSENDPYRFCSFWSGIGYGF